ncbi:MAG: adenylyl-sulfate kinase [Nocardioides sp.]|nr:adenylyl-sulfate kinase [Nocardioides sp.]
MSGLSQHCPSPRELDDLELLVSGALAPLAGFDEPGSPVTLALPDDLAALPELELVDPEGLPLARVWRTDTGSWGVTPLSSAEYGPFRRLHLSPAQVREQYAGRTFVPVTGPVTDAQLTQLGELAGSTGLVLLALTGTGTPDLSSTALLRASLRVAEALGGTDVVAVPLAAHGDADADHDLGVQVVQTYAAGDPVVGLVDGGAVLPDLADIVDFDQPPLDEQGLVLFFTGLSGSGKSTLARALMDRLLEAGERTITSLDGDVVRRNLSAGLTFSKEDRETNIRRIGWVAAEISRHGGLAVVSPIAPFDETRQQVRQMVADAGGAFFLVHVATPLEECERRDRKGLYAKARAGEIPEFTGISSPYEEPQDADVRVDTTGRTIDDALTDVIDALAAAGYVDLRDATPAPYVGRRSAAPRSSSSAEGDAPRSSSSAEGGTTDARTETPQADHQPRPWDQPTQAMEIPQVPTGPTDGPLQVLYVCTANICRSPWMELMSRQLAGQYGLGTRVYFGSAGTHGFIDREMDPTMAQTLQARGVDTSWFRSRALTREMVDEADLVLTAESTHRQFILDDQPNAFRKVVTLGQAAEVARQSPGVPLMQALAERRGTAGPETDVGDPYGRGPEAAEQSAQKIETLLHTVVSALNYSSTIE